MKKNLNKNVLDLNHNQVTKNNAIGENNYAY